MALYIVGMGSGYYDVANESGEDMLKRLFAPHPFNAATVIPEALISLNCRQRQSKLNSLMCHAIFQSYGKSNILLIVPNSSMVDKRVRNQAVIVDLPIVESR